MRKVECIIKINEKWLKKQIACKDGIKWFTDNFSGKVDAQTVLDALAREDRIDWAWWLAERCPPDESVLKIRENIETEHSVFYLGKIVVYGKISCKHLLAGGEIFGGRGINVKGSLVSRGITSAGKTIAGSIRTLKRNAVYK